MSVKTKFGEVTVFSQQFPWGFEHRISGASVPVEDGMIAIGGGATGSPTPGIFITESYPSPDLNSWVVGGQDHLDRDDGHALHGYAIGLRLIDPSGAPMTSNEVRNKIHVVWSAPSGLMNHAEVYTENAWPGGVLVGGGFRIQCPGGPGNLAIESRPERSNDWIAGSKDHLDKSPAYITACAIYLEEEFHFCLSEYFAVVPVREEIKSEYVSHPSVRTTLPPRGDVLLTGGGAWVGWGPAGNLLWRMEPFADDASHQGYVCAATDHRVTENAQMSAYALGIALDVRT
jgi:hypothetical protein